ncbi:MAG: menaquinone biosynthetic enzyme MqnA/MqnD family protein [Pirellula sp.]
MTASKPFPVGDCGALVSNSGRLGDSTQESSPQSQASATTRIGAVAYLNTKPLIYGLEERLVGVDGSLQLELPSRLADRLEAGSLDVALIPVVEYFQHLDRYRPVSDAVIACCGPVWSVRILFRKAPELVRTLAIDEGSRTSVALSKILFAARFDRIPETVPLPIDNDFLECQADAVLVIGDRAMKPERYRSYFASDWDLGEEWYQLTGLPFVFAMWVARDPCFATEGWARILESARNEGCGHAEEIVARHASSYRLTESECRDYLTHYLRFRLGTQEKQGLLEFHRRCRELGLIPTFDGTAPLG